MFVEDTNKIFVVEDNRVVQSFVKEAYYGSCPHPDCEEHGKTKYDIKKNENCKSCGTSMKVEFPKTKKKKKDSDKDSSEETKKESKTASPLMETPDTDWPISPAPVEGIAEIGRERVTPEPLRPSNASPEVIAMRIKRLEGLGFSSQQAEELAKNPDIDLHEIEDLVNKGVPIPLIISVKASNLDEVGEEDEDINNDKKVNSTDEYLENRRKAIEKNIKGEDKDSEEDDKEEKSTHKSSVNESENQMFEEIIQEKETVPMSKGSRVSYREKEGTIVSVIPGLYGDTYGVRFDDGKVAEFLDDQLTSIDSEKPVYLSSVEEIISDHINYDILPANTIEELESKTRIARSLNLRAKGLIVDSKISMNDRVKLDEIITTTSADISDFKEGIGHLQQVEAKAYLARAPKYKINDDFEGWGSLSRTKSDEDISWVNDIEESFESVSDQTLISLASDTIKNLSREQLQDEKFMQEVNYYATLNLPSEATPRFASFLQETITMKLAEPESKVAKTASTESFDDVADEALFM